MNYNSLRVFNKVNQLCRNWRSQLYSLFVFGSSKYIYKGKNVHIYGFKTLSIGKACHIMDNSDIRGNVNIGNNVFIHENVLIRSMECSISIGNNTTVNRNTNILAQVTIGSNVSIAPNVVIVGMNHVFSNLDDTIKSQGSTSKGIIIEDDVWIGANTVVLPGVTIGKGTVIGAGSVVTHDIPAGVVAFGAPCRVIREISGRDRLYYRKDLELNPDWDR